MAKFRLRPITDAEHAAGRVGRTPDGRVYGWVSVGGQVYGGTGYPIHQTNFVLDSHNFAIVVLQPDNGDRLLVDTASALDSLADLLRRRAGE